VGPWRWSVIWGNIGRQLRREVVEAWDSDDALATGASLHPEWEQPRMAFLVTPTLEVEIDAPRNNLGG
jgi:hypothetical protein